MVYREPEEVRLLKERTRRAVDLAMQGQWAEAAQVNREILEDHPDDTEALNRLGKALVEVGHPLEALSSFQRVLELCPANPIAVKNAARLTDALASGMAAMKQTASCGQARALPSRAFVADSSKSAQVALLVSDHAGHPSPGTPVELERNGETLSVKDGSGSTFGLVPPRLARRLVCLMEGGNRYDGAVCGVTNGVVTVMLREAYQHPSQSAKVSFLPTAASAPAEPEPPVEAPAPAWVASSPAETAIELLEDAGLAWVADEPELELAAVGTGIDWAMLDDATFHDELMEEE